MKRFSLNHKKSADSREKHPKNELVENTPPAPLKSSLVYGLHSVEELLRVRPQQIQAIWIQQHVEPTQQKVLRGLIELAERHGISLLPKSRQQLDTSTDRGNHQGVVAVCNEYAYAPLEQLYKGIKAPLILILDSVTDPQNLGALIRSAYVFGASGVVIPQDRSAPVTPTVLKIASGAAEHLPIARVKNLVRALDELKEAGVWLYAAALAEESQATKAPWQHDWKGAVGLVLGSEGGGVRALVQKTCDDTVSIPMQGHLQGASLNVAACGAVLLYEANRQRVKK